MRETILIIIIVLGMYVLIATMMGILRNLNNLKEENMTKEEAINKLAHIIFDAAKGGYIPFNVDGEHCAMSIARSKINEFFPPSNDASDQPIPNLDEAINRFWDSCIKHKNERGGNVIWSNKLEIEVLARYFYELGINKAKGE